LGFGEVIAMRMFGRPRGLLGRLGGLIMARVNNAHGIGVAERLRIRPTDDVLEVGFGSGVVIACLTRLATAGYIAGVDPSVVMLAQACSRNATAIARGQVELLRGKVENLPFDGDCFDKVLAINSMQVWPDVHRGLREILRVLKPGGALALGFAPYSGQRPEGLGDTLIVAGFDKVQLVKAAEGFSVLAEKPTKRVGEDLD
jgi:ubiquinone/menaquinone biosynthesis C-methylase UbiE